MDPANCDGAGRSETILPLYARRECPHPRRKAGHSSSIFFRCLSPDDCRRARASRRITRLLLMSAALYSVVCHLARGAPFSPDARRRTMVVVVRSLIASSSTSSSRNGVENDRKQILICLFNHTTRYLPLYTQVQFYSSVNGTELILAIMFLLHKNPLCALA